MGPAASRFPGDFLFSGPLSPVTPRALEVMGRDTAFTKRRRFSNTHGYSPQVWARGRLPGQCLVIPMQVGEVGIPGTW